MIPGKPAFIISIGTERRKGKGMTYRRDCQPRSRRRRARVRLETEERETRTEEGSKGREDEIKNK